MSAAGAQPNSALSLQIFRAGYSPRAPGQMTLGLDWPHLAYDRRVPGDRLIRPARPVTPVQIALPLNPNALPTITPLLELVEGVLVRIASAGAAMPNNPVLGERCGRRRQSMERALTRLERSGRIVIERERGRRRVRLPALGLSTDWGEARPGHKPFCSRGRHEAPLPPKPRQPMSLPLAVSHLSLPPLPSLSGFEWFAPPVIASAPRACQWPLWSDDQKPTGQYCGERIARKDASWCDEHFFSVYPARRKTAQRQAA